MPDRDAVSWSAASGAMPAAVDSDRDSSGTYAAFYRREFAPVARSCFLVLHDRARAEEVAQDAFVELFVRWSKISRYERPDAWVRRVALRIAVRTLHRDRLRETLSLRVTSGPKPEPADLDVLRLVRMLPPRQRAVVALYYYEDRPIAEVGDLLGLSANAVKVTLHRARRTLGASLGDEVTSGLH
jgi:RNA polymerase sigma factor (sigma-70 family)